MFLDARQFEGLIDSDQAEYDGRGLILHISHQQAFSGIPRFALDSEGKPIMTGSSMGTMPMQRDPLRFADPCVVIFKESISEPLPEGVRATIIGDARVTMFGMIFANLIIPKRYYGPLQVTVYPARRMEIAVGFPIARLYFLDDSTEVRSGSTKKSSSKKPTEGGQ